MLEVAKRLDKRGVKYVMFQEPDLDDTYTAICTEATREAKKATSNLPMFGKKSASDELAEEIHAMAHCEQTTGLSVLDHGIQVHNKFWDLNAQMAMKIYLNEEIDDAWVLPRWFVDNIKLIDKIIDSIPDKERLISNYTIFHDIGKPHVKTVGEDGRAHFPNHSEKSAELAEKYFSDKRVAELMRHDMFFHTCKAADVEKAFTERDLGLLWLNYVVAIAEIHANAEMFGGTDSTSFKIKFKQLDRRGKLLLKLTKENNDL